MKKTRQLGTQVIHAGLPQPKQGGPFNNGPTFASTFHLSGETESAHFQYGRFSNPTWEALEDGLTELEGGETVIFPSGMAGVAGLFFFFN